jgi:hypothetical protein
LKITEIGYKVAGFLYFREVKKLTIMPIENYAFDGPHRSLKNLENKAGVFVIMSEFVGKFYLLDVDVSDDVKSAIENHVRRKCWERYRKGKIRYAVLYEKEIPADRDSEIERKIRSKYKTVPCGGVAELLVEGQVA